MTLSAEAAPAPPLPLRVDDDVAVLEIPEDLEYDALRDLVDAHLPDVKDGIRGVSVRLDLGARPIALFDLRRLIHHLEETHELAVTGLYATDAAIWRFAERELKLKLFLRESDDDAPAGGSPDDADPTDDDPVEDPPLALDPDHLRDAEKVASTVDDEAVPEALEAPEEAPEDPGRRTLHVHRTVRSGNAVRFDGDVTVFGDVNPGAQVTAAGSVIVLGALKGVVHAGATGDEAAFILALSLQATQLRIGRRIAIPPEASPTGPEIALVRDGRIVIEPYHSKLPVRGS